MPRIKVTLRSGETRVVEGGVGQSLREALVAGGVDEIDAVSSCGGCCACATCHVYVDPADFPRLPAAESQEKDLLDATEGRQPTSRLCCQIRLTDELDGLSVTVAPEW